MCAAACSAERAEEKHDEEMEFDYSGYESEGLPDAPKGRSNYIKIAEILK